MRTVEVKILGQRFKVKSDDGEEYIQNLAKFVNDQITEIQRTSQAVATHNVTVLAALNIADALFKAREEKEQVLREVRERIRRLVKTVRQASGEGADKD